MLVNIAIQLPLRQCDKLHRQQQIYPFPEKWIIFLTYHSDIGTNLIVEFAVQSPLLKQFVYNNMNLILSLASFKIRSSPGSILVLDKQYFLAFLRN